MVTVAPLIESYDESYSFAWDRVSDRSRLIVDTRDPTPTDGTSLPDGSWWVNSDVHPQSAWSWNEATHLWRRFGQLMPDPTTVHSNRLWQACLNLAMRAWKIPDAALGVVGGFDVGAIYVGRIDRDTEAMLLGYRGTGIPTAQVWPTLDEVKTRLQITGVGYDSGAQHALDAAIELVSEYVAGSFGVS